MRLVSRMTLQSMGTSLLESCFEELVTRSPGIMPTITRRKLLVKLYMSYDLK